MLPCIDSTIEELEELFKDEYQIASPQGDFKFVKHKFDGTTWHCYSLCNDAWIFNRKIQVKKPTIVNLWQEFTAYEII